MKKIKTILAIALVLCFCASAIGCGQNAAQPQSTHQPIVAPADEGNNTPEPTAAPAETPEPAAEPVETDALPAVGDRIGGFVVKSVTPVDVLGATGVLFEHEKNGALLYYLASEDPNVSFDITFRTPALDDTGKAHVFEHMTIGGSEKYPDPNLFFPISSQTYNTYCNAATYQGMTTYPLSSLSEDQLFTMMDFYLSGVFSPFVRTEERMVSREAWRYELNGADEPITLTGTVYSEMQGVLTMETLAKYNGVNTMFKDGTCSHISGGLPAEIRTLTHEELMTFHDTYYHPSNSLTVLYGKLDYKRFIEYIDTEYMSKFDRQEIEIDMGRVEPYTQTQYSVFEVPVDANAQTENVSYLRYGIVCDGIDIYDDIALSLLAQVLGSDSSSVKAKVAASFPGATLVVETDVDQPSPSVNFVVSSINEDDSDALVAAIDEGLAEIAANGISQDVFDAVLAKTKLQLMATVENPTLGTAASQVIAMYWTYYDSLDYYTIYNTLVDELTLDDLNALFNKYVANNAYRAVSVTKPAPGEAEKNAAAISDELAALKAAMSEEEIQKLVADTKSFAEWSSAAPDAELIAKLTNMTVDMLPETVPEGDIIDETIDGVRYVSTDVAIGDLAELAIQFDASSLPIDMIQDAAAYLDLLGGVSTTKHTREELATMLARYLGTFKAGLTSDLSKSADIQDRYVMQTIVYGLGENAQPGLELIGELWLDTDLANIGEIKSVLAQNYNAIPYLLEADVLTAQINRCRAKYYTAAAYEWYVNTINCGANLRELIELADSDPDKLTQRLTAARDALLNTSNATVVCAGNAEAVALYKAEAGKLLATLPNEPREAVDYTSLRLEAKNEAVINNSTVHMNIVYAPSTGYSGKNAAIASMISDRYMLPQLRNALGAYGAYASFGEASDLLYTYRDPNLAGSFEIFEALPEFLRTVELTQAEIDNYIIGSYGTLVTSKGKLTQAFDRLGYYLTGVTDEIRLGWMKDAKTTTLDDVRVAAERVENIVTNGVRSTSGAESTLTPVMDMFENVYRVDVG